MQQFRLSHQQTFYRRIENPSNANFQASRRFAGGQMRSLQKLPSSLAQVLEIARKNDMMSYNQMAHTNIRTRRSVTS
jgi:hypothetical protein